MPRHDFSTPPRRKHDTRVEFLKRIPPKRRKGKDKDEGGVSVDPRKPNNLSGGAAAELEFGDD